MNYAAILFDMDGTLLETGPLWNRATRMAVAEHNIHLTEEEHASLAWRSFREVLTEKGFDDETISTLRLTRDNFLLPAIRAEAVWRDDARELLTSIVLPKAIVTTSHAYVFQVIDETLGIKAMVDTVVMGDDVLPNYKPHPKGLLLACSRMNVDPTTCVYIGDQECDLQAAASAGMDSILIRGAFTPKDLIHHKMTGNFAEMRSLLT